MKFFASAIPYLLLITFSTPGLKSYDLDNLKAVEQSPYDGIAVPLVAAYDTYNFTEKDFADSIALFKNKSTKHIWPWIFFNRFIGNKDDVRTLSSQSQKKYFRQIKGMDIFDESGALQDFISIWKLSFKIAKETGSRGIIIDPEAYNNPKTYNLDYLARELGRSKEAVKDKLIEVGGLLAQAAYEIYPDATMWFLFSGFGNPIKRKGTAELEYRSVSYIILGMLQKSRALGSKQTYVAGGELSLGYCHKSLDSLNSKIRIRNQKYNAVIDNYPNLRLGGTIAPWHDAYQRKTYFAKGECKESDLRNIQQFKPYFNSLFNSYDFMWIYAAGNVGYNPYDPNIAANYNIVIQEVIDELSKAGEPLKVEDEELPKTEEPLKAVEIKGLRVVD